MINGMWVFSEAFNSVKDAYNAILEVRATGAWESVVSSFDIDDNTIPLFKTSCLNLNILKKAIIESKRYVLLEHDIGYLELYGDGKLVDRSIRDSYLAMSIIADNIDTADEALHFQQDRDFNYTETENPWSLDPNTSLEDLTDSGDLKSETPMEALAIYFKKIIAKQKGNRFLIEQTASDNITFVLVDKQSNVLDSMVFLLDDLDQLDEEYESSLYTKSSFEE